MPRRGRAGAVCTLCHARKVRCNLQDCAEGPCHNCKTANQPCIRRERARKARKTSSGQVEAVSRVPAYSPHSIARAASDAEAVLNSPARTESQPDRGFIHERSFLSCNSPVAPVVPIRARAGALTAKGEIMQATEALVLLDEPLRQALIDAYFLNIHFRFPVVDREVVIGPGASELLIQAVCLAGSLTTRMVHQGDLSLVQRLYDKVKMLICLDYEKDMMNVLKASCLMSIWSCEPPHVITLNNSMHWTGTAIRLAIQMGLHRESTYTGREQAACWRRIWWHLCNSDKLQAMAWGRPMLIRPSDTDVRLPTVEDSSDIDALSFIYLTKICNIIGEIAELVFQKRSGCPEQLTGVETSLHQWLLELPPTLQLFDDTGRRLPYCRAASELHILYFTSVNISRLFFQFNTDRNYTSLGSIVASSCAARLYKEIDLRDDVKKLLPINSFLCMAAAAPQIYYRPGAQVKEEMRCADIQTLRSVMCQMSMCYSAAEHVLTNIDQLIRSASDPLLADRVMHVPRDISLYQQGYFDDTLSRLFPFPVSLCDNMDLLQSRNQGLQTDVVGPRMSTNDVPLDLRFDDAIPFDDLFGWNLDASLGELVGANSGGPSIH